MHVAEQAECPLVEQLPAAVWRVEEVTGGREVVREQMEGVAWIKASTSCDADPDLSTIHSGIQVLGSDTVP